MYTPQDLEFGMSKVKQPASGVVSFHVWWRGKRETQCPHRAKEQTHAVLQPAVKMESSWPRYLLLVYFQTQSAWALNFQHKNLERHIQTIAESENPYRKYLMPGINEKVGILHLDQITYK